MEEKKKKKDTPPSSSITELTVLYRREEEATRKKVAVRKVEDFPLTTKCGLCLVCASYGKLSPLRIVIK